ncbi:MATH domain and coiled-coil domain-containing protein At2g05420-like [Arachis ipaensis]|uniref:MATH domain and coiled-coil domain-containing protein At2g05420-like n=1 Tax=Arachis ipaensis TaxID=130454 RepID=UPI000A2AF296|nr:MATH domain and coiled-coil domain-containing protein At2g05420-like [Arachis ipaensis]
MIAKEYVETHQRILQSEGLKTKNQSFEDYIEGNENTAFNKRIYYLPLTKFSSFSEMEDQGEVETTITSKYTWIIKNFSKLKCDKLYSETFFTGKHPWRIRIHPEGNKVNCLSIYLSVGDNANFPAGWSKTANIKMSLINQLYSDDTITHVAVHTYKHNSTGVVAAYGFPSFVSLPEFRDPSEGFLVKDTCIIVAEVSVENSGHEDTNVDHLPKEMYSPTSTCDELINFKGLCQIEKDHVNLLEEACLKHPSIIESHRKRKRSQKFTEWSITTLGKVLHFLKTKKVKDMNDDACKELQDLWEELEMVKFDDLSWLKPHVESALSMKNYAERLTKVKRLKGSVVALEVKRRNLKELMILAETDLERARKELAIAEKGFVKRELDDELGCGIS